MRQAARKISQTTQSTVLILAEMGCARQGGTAPSGLMIGGGELTGSSSCKIRDRNGTHPRVPFAGELTCTADAGRWTLPDVELERNDSGDGYSLEFPGCIPRRLALESVAWLTAKLFVSMLDSNRHSSSPRTPLSLVSHHQPDLPSSLGPALVTVMRRTQG